MSNEGILVKKAQFSNGSGDGIKKVSINNKLTPEDYAW